jgi:hypothetical protein
MHTKIARKMLLPYKIDEPKMYDWWTTYISEHIA